MNQLGFGLRVMVEAVTMRVVGYRDSDVERFKMPGARDLTPFGFSPRPDVWPGESVPAEWDPPKGERFQVEPILNGQAVVRYRRLELAPPVLGIVIGFGRRHEGNIDDTDVDRLKRSMGGLRRTIGLYQVALQPQRSSKAMVALVHPRDLNVVTTGTDAPKRRTGSGGRLAGGVRAGG